MEVVYVLNARRKILGGSEVGIVNRYHLCAVDSSPGACNSVEYAFDLIWVNTRPCLKSVFDKRKHGIKQHYIFALVAKGYPLAGIASVRSSDKLNTMCSIIVFIVPAVR